MTETETETDNAVDFFLVVPPGFEKIAQLELDEKIPGLEVRPEHGGLEVRAPFAIGLALNANLKIPSAVLLRIASFKCRDLPKLYQKVSNIRWGRYLIGANYQLSVASAKSRVLHEKKIEKAVREGIERHFQKQPPKKTDSPFAFEVQVRFYDDQCTISLDLSGEPLFKRGYKDLHARAPLRENLAAGLFYTLWRRAGGFTRIVDPMCGSGTFLLEASSFWQRQRTREFAYEHQPTWLPAEISMSEEGSPLKEFVGFDRAAEPLQALRESWRTLELADRQVQLSVRDVFGNEAIELGGEKTAFICNPPYGERLALPTPPKIFYPALMRQLLKGSPAAIGIILPTQAANVVPTRFSGYTVSEELEFRNGGLPVKFRVYSAG